VIEAIEHVGGHRLLDLDPAIVGLALLELFLAPSGGVR